MIQIFDNKYTKDMALEKIIKWIRKHFDRVDRVICANDNLCSWVLRAKTKHGYVKLDVSEYKGDLEAELEEIINKIK